MRVFDTVNVKIVRIGDIGENAPWDEMEIVWQAAGNNYSFTRCLCGTYDVICEIFNEEFAKVDDDRLWGLTSGAAQKAVNAAYDRVKYLEAHPGEYSKDDERIRSKWGSPLRII